MSGLILKSDTEREIVLDAPRTAAWGMALALGVVAVAVRLLFPGQWIAPAMLLVFAVWTLTGALQIHRLHLDLERGVYVYRRGFFLARPRRQGSLEEIVGVALERHEAAGGLAASRLRSRWLALEFDGWPDGEGVFVLGFPMGPRVAEDKAADYARRLGTEVIDRTEDAAQETAEIPPDPPFSKGRTKEIPPDPPSSKAGT